MRLDRGVHEIKISTGLQCGTVVNKKQHYKRQVIDIFSVEQRNITGHF